jgi:ribosomal protein S18 acetylase RimI-like enzyme
MLEVGIFDLLIFILQGDESYDCFLRAFKKRFGEIAKKSIDSIPQIKNPTLTLQKNKDNNAVKAQAKALILLATKLFSENELNMSRNYSPNSILDIIADLKRVESMSTISDADNRYKVSYVLNSVIDVNKFIYNFYDGLVEYTKELKWLEFNDDVYYENNNSTRHHSDYRDTYKRCLEKFKAKTESNKKYNRDLIALDRIFKMNFINATYLESAKQCIADSFTVLKRLNADCARSKTEQCEAFYEATGRKQIFSPKVADACCNAIMNAIDNISIPIDVSCVKSLFKTVIDYFDYLRCGNSRSVAILEDSIYPIFGTYSEGVVSRDGYRYSHINTYHSDSNVPVMIRCISEDELSFEEIYYFVPNINRVAETHRTINNGLYDIEKLWIRPISIPCRTYSPAGLVEFMPLTSYSDYAATAELLYQTDGTIYPSLFGNKENAKKALPIMFNNPDSIFYKNNIFIAKIDGNVCGVISYYEKIPQWNENIIKNDLRMAGLEYSNEVGNYFSDTFNDSLGTDNALVCDLCVAESYRNQGVAKNLLNNIIKRSEIRGKNIIISTYADNDIALRLYVKMGFVAYMTSSDSRGEADGEYKYVQLIRFI